MQERELPLVIILFYFILFSFCLRSGYEMRIGFAKFGWIDLYLGIWVTLKLNVHGNRNR